ncbi:hypothetical protein Tco_0919062 [Tanacetum coccineum]
MDDSLVNDRFKTGEGFDAVPPPYTGNYLPPRPDLSFAGLDEFVFQSVVRKTTTSVPETETSISKTSKDIVEKPKTVRPIIMESLVKKKQKGAILELKRRHLKNTIFCTYMSYPAMKIRRINASSAQETRNDQFPIRPVVSAAEGNGENAVKSSACWIWRPTGNVIDHISKDSRSYMHKRFDYGNPQYTLLDQGIFDSGCSRHITGNKSFITDYQEIDGGFVAFGGSPKEGKITRKGKIRTGKLDFEDVYFVKDLKFNIFSVSQMCDKKNSVLFTETECLVLSPDFKLLDES